MSGCKKIPTKFWQLLLICCCAVAARLMCQWLWSLCYSRMLLSPSKAPFQEISQIPFLLLWKNFFNVIRKKEKSSSLKSLPMIFHSAGKKWLNFSHKRSSPPVVKTAKNWKSIVWTKSMTYILCFRAWTLTRNSCVAVLLKLRVF